MSISAILVLEDGTSFKGTSIGVSGQRVGEVVFNTSMTGYQEILTDPSYNKQLITLTYPHIGNVGTNPEDFESKDIYAAGLIVRSVSPIVSNWRSTLSLPSLLKSKNVVAISDIDTRHLTSLLREKGAMAACIMAGDDLDYDKALAAAKACPSLAGQDLAQVVTTSSVYTWNERSVQFDQIEDLSDSLADSRSNNQNASLHVVVYDFGVKHSILSRLADLGCKVTVVPAKTPVEDVLRFKPSGVLLSNGPGDPEPCHYAILAAKELMAKKIPIFGICLGHQILGLACGAKTLKMKFGHHGGNHPVSNVLTGSVLITSQNHGFAVDEASLPNDLEVTHRSLFDGSLQGFRHKSLPVMSFQGHPEAGPGPNDVVPLFHDFVTLMNTFISNSSDAYSYAE